MRCLLIFKLLRTDPKYRKFTTTSTAKSLIHGTRKIIILSYVRLVHTRNFVNTRFTWMTRRKMHGYRKKCVMGECGNSSWKDISRRASLTFIFHKPSETRPMWRHSWLEKTVRNAPLSFY